jgi:U11/U12 small nuclear ribonucleoprotein SNRNP35
MRRYAFIEFKHLRDCEQAYKACRDLKVRDTALLVDYERGRTMQGWVPRRLGGGLGGNKASGQVRFGGRYCAYRFTVDRNVSRHEDAWRQLPKQ